MANTIWLIARASSHENGAACVVDDLARDRPEEQRRDGPMAARADHQEVRAEVVRSVDDRAGGPAAEHRSLDGRAGSTEPCHHLAHRVMGVRGDRRVEIGVQVVRRDPTALRPASTIGSITLTIRMAASLGQAIASARATAFVAPAEPSYASSTRISSCLLALYATWLGAEAATSVPRTIAIAVGKLRRGREIEGRALSCSAVKPADGRGAGGGGDATRGDRLAPSAWLNRRI